MTIGETDVLVIGGGPVGLGLAIDLLQRGVRCMVIEKSAEPHGIPKGQNLTQRTGEHFRAWGVSREIRKAAPIPRRVGSEGVTAYGSLLGPWHYPWLRRASVREFYAADNERLPQYCTEQVLRRRFDELASRHDSSAGYGMLCGWEAEDILVTGDGGSASIRNRDDDDHARIKARFVVGCDGAGSRVRRAVGIEQDVEDHHKHMALLVFRSTQLDRLLSAFSDKSFFNVLTPELEGYWQFLGRVDLEGNWFFHAPVPHDATRETFDFHSYLHRVVGAAFDIEFRHVGFWDLRFSIARDYRDATGSAFIAGDAAHSHPPYGGFGINLGFEDARNLAWKLSAELQGWGGPSLLDSYTAERRPVFASTADDFIARLIREDAAFVRDFNPATDVEAFRAAWTRRAGDGNAEVSRFCPNYAGSPVVFGEPGAESGAAGIHDHTAQAGFHLSPLALPGGRSLVDVAGPGFTLVSVNADAGDVTAISNAASKAEIPLRIVETARTETTEKWRARLILMRPDGFVALAANSLESDQSAEAVILRASGYPT
ncbi:MAG: FAD-dependent monooxygenase [Paracoccaceae bacterium]|nr:FAD-dependent monooxygenase [Paracoccaceae bacterium]